MSGVHVAKSIPPAPPPAPAKADVQVMQDVLYDILATGLDPEQAQVPVEAIERFLHEHARTSKSLEEFRAFFATHGLSTSGRMIRRGPPLPISMPPIPTKAPVEDAAVLKFPVELAPAPLRAPELTAAQALFTSSPLEPAAPPPRATTPWLWAAVAGLTLALSGLAYHGYATVTQLQRELGREREASQEQSAKLDALKDHATKLESGLQASEQMVQRVDEKNDLVIQTLVEAQTRKGYRKPQH